MNRDSPGLKCEHCGSNLQFGARERRLVCPHCSRQRSISGLVAPHRGAQRGLPISRAEGMPSPEASGDPGAVYCPNCAARVPFDGISYAAGCAYCGSSVIFDVKDASRLMPKAILPFAISEADAFGIALEKLRQTSLNPQYFTEDPRLRSVLKGVFLPYWVFDANSDTTFQANVAHHHYEQVGRGFDNEILRTVWTVVDDRLTYHLDEIVVPASAYLAKPFDAALEPWDFAALVPFQQDFLAGFHAGPATVPPIDAHKDARHRMHGVIRSEVARVLGASDIIFQHSDTRFSDETFKLVLLPFWIADCPDGRKRCRIFVNGQTGIALAQIREGDPKVGWSGWLAFGLFAPALLVLAVLLVRAFGTVLQWYGP